ncbi:diiron oxygenase [Nitrogeniibacter aestuarii]|uniref:diiron oxygenase n=1 Tax=Nitrogeniibacter aestuarii TaxID=2815343 RepID=UPI001D107F5B|nr:diiron oxygenase [Nitrogeniibacter aestuarii]
METLERTQTRIGLTEVDRAKVGTLIRASHRHVMDLETVLPWADGIDFSRNPKLETGSWIYGTEYWDALTPEQRNELLWKEVARDVSMFIWLEQSLPPLYMNYANQEPFGMLPEVYEYLMIFSREEITHTLMFRRYLDLAKLPLFDPPRGAYAQFTRQLPEMHPVLGILSTLMLEWVAELNAIYLTQGRDNEPLTRKMFHEHHIEEVRHIAFGKRVVEYFFENGPAEVIDRIRGSFAPLYQNLKNEVTYNRDIARHTSFKFPIAEDDDAAVERIRQSENNRRMNGERFAEVDTWFAKLGIL